MMKKDPCDWTEEDARQLIGQPESLTLEFKESALCSTGTAFARILSKEISAFANAEGGTIVLGMAENRGRPRLALDLDDGIDPHAFSLEQLRHIVDFSVRPLLSGIRCHAIPLSGKRAGRVAYVIVVPKGETAYQSGNYVYYTRNEFRDEPIQDHLIRLLMFRGSAATARLELGNCEILPKDRHHEYRFDLVMANTGKQSIHDFLLAVKLTFEGDEAQFWAPTMFVDSEDAIQDELKSVESMLEIGENPAEYRRHELLQGPGIPFQSGDELRCSFRRIMQLLYHVDGKKLFPQDRVIFPGGKWLIDFVPPDVALAAYHPMLKWTIFLDNAPPCSGEIDVSAAFQNIA